MLLEESWTSRENDISTILVVLLGSRGKSKGETRTANDETEIWSTACTILYDYRASGKSKGGGIGNEIPRRLV